jgi:hypothetical protein
LCQSFDTDGVFYQHSNCPSVPLLPATDEADANLDEYLPDGTPMIALALNLPTALRHFPRLPFAPELDRLVAAAISNNTTARERQD